MPPGIDGRLFSPRTFELLSFLHEDPRYDVYKQHREEFQANVEKPTKALMSYVVRALPEELRSQLETERDLFSRFNKNDYGKGGAWPFYWSALYPKGGTRVAAPQLFIWLNYQRVEVGFSIGDYGPEFRRRLHEQWRSLRTELHSLLTEAIDSKDIAFGSHPEERHEPPPTEIGLVEWLDRLDEFRPTARRLVHRDDAIEMSTDQWVHLTRITFTDLFPLFILATSRNPIADLEEYLGEGNGKRNPRYPLKELAADTYLPMELLRRWVAAIWRKKQVILYGPPGTGKTFVADRLAKHLVGGGLGFIEVVQFHPAYAYEDFVQGIRPVEGSDGNLTYPLVPGRFLDFCRRAKHRKDVCVLIIDEINRTNLSRVLGELMYLLEYRGESIPLAGGESFSIPENVRIIGTMNTADRSIALVDHALRRRFAFLRLKPDFDVLHRYHAARTGLTVDGLIRVLERVNTEIGDDHYHVGISFFLTESLEDELEDIWRMEVEPYLEEYFFSEPKRAEAFRWDKVREEIGI